jgi:uncharacterized membrane protein YeiH
MSAKPVFDALAILSCSVMAVLVSVMRRRRFGAALAVGVLASVAGGSLRDILLGAVPVFWLAQPWQLYAAISTTAVLYLLLRNASIAERMLVIPDALSVAIPASIGCRSALADQIPYGVACAVGVAAGMAGGILRDLLCEREPAIFKRELCGSAALLAAAAVCCAASAGFTPGTQLAIGSVAGAAARMAAIRYHISLAHVAPRRG